MILYKVQVQRIIFPMVKHFSARYMSFVFGHEILGSGTFCYFGPQVSGVPLFNVI